MSSPTSLRKLACSCLCLFLVLTACSAPGAINLLPATPTPTLTPSPTPTITPIPLALSVNGEGITVAEFDTELARYQQAQTALQANLLTGSKLMQISLLDYLS